MGIDYSKDENSINFVQPKVKTTTDKLSYDVSDNLTGTDYGTKRALDVSIQNTSLPVTVDGGLLAGVTYDYYARVLSGGSKEIETWTYRLGGTPPSSGTIVAVVVATYTDGNREDLVSVERTT